MSKAAKTLDRILRGSADSNIRFEDICHLLENLGFSRRIKGDHHIFYHDHIPEILNLQPRKGQAKPYQVRQVRDIIQQYSLDNLLN